MLPACYTRRVEMTFKSHLPLNEATVEGFVLGAMDSARAAHHLGSPIRDVTVAIDEVGPAERIK